MASGDLTRAMQYSGDNAINAIRNLFKNIQMQRQRDESRKSINQIVGNWSNKNFPLQTKTPIQSDNTPSIISGITGVNSQSNNIVPPLRNETSQGFNVNEITPYQQNKEVNQGYLQTLMNMLGNPDIQQEDVQKFVPILEALKQQKMVQPSVITPFTREPDKTYGETTTNPETGNRTERIIQQGIPKRNIKIIPNVIADRDMPEFGIKKDDRVIEERDENNPDAAPTYRKEWTKPEKPDYAGANYNLRSKEYADKQAEKLSNYQSTLESLDGALSEFDTKDSKGQPPKYVRIIDENGREQRYNKSQIMTKKNQLNSKIKAMTNDYIKNSSKGGNDIKTKYSADYNYIKNNYPDLSDEQIITEIKKTNGIK